MEYRNLFLEKTNDELKKLYEQYLEWNRLGVLGDNELGKIRDMYCEMDFNAPLTVLELDLLRTIAKIWYVV
jgi:hypothetical protein